MDQSAWLPLVSILCVAGIGVVYFRCVRKAGPAKQSTQPGPRAEDYSDSSGQLPSDSQPARPASPSAAPGPVQVPWSAIGALGVLAVLLVGALYFAPEEEQGKVLAFGVVGLIVASLRLLVGGFRNAGRAGN